MKQNYISLLQEHGFKVLAKLGKDETSQNLKAQNVLLHNPPGSDCVVLKISDYGLTKVNNLAQQQTQNNYLRTLLYKAPEVLIAKEEGNLVFDPKDNECNKIILKFKDKDDDQGRNNAIDAGITEVLINILESRELNLITYPLLESFHVITLGASETRIKIYQKKNPYSSLLRILQHQNNEIVLSSIYSICSLLRGGLYTTQQGLPHPHFEIINQIDGINKIFSLINNNPDKKVKDAAAICLGRLHRSKEIKDQNMKIQIISHLKSLLTDPDDWTKQESFIALGFLAKNSANSSEIVKDIDLNVIIENMKKPLQGNDKEQEEIQQKQEIQSFYLSTLLQNSKDNLILRKSAINAGLVQIYLSIFETWKLSQISRAFTDAFFELSIKNMSQVKDFLYPNWKPYPGLIRLLDHEEDLIITDSLASIHIILSDVQSSLPDNSPHPHFNIIASNDGIRKIFSVLKRKDINDFNQKFPFKCLNLILQCREIPDQQLKVDIITYLIETAINPSNSLNKYAFSTLSILAQNPAGSIESSSIQHPHLNEITSNDGIEKIISFIKRPDINKERRETGANCIIRLFHETEIQHSKSFNEIIKKNAQSEKSSLIIPR
ncbi:MAG: hypothetical protein EZS28_006351 [Streblomastix strix]|uniref:Protein kinase domain-containing protein n=1 Tax=Streblomastix strix TaxID=222440 RepID=A0A5J4WU66_9EUKA|nr:MAG: hypothetical protein EZS28_006351 [Streblomastix strix]